MRIFAGLALLVSLGSTFGLVACGGGGAASDAAVPSDGGVDAGWQTDLGAGLLVTASGPVQGTVTDGVGAWLGIPYVAPPVGERRWRPPAPPAPWTEPRAATAFGPMCPQLQSDLPLPGLDGPQDEDCLTLNAWSVAAEPGEGRPVMVWIHGGGFTIGGGGNPAYDGAFLAREEGVVVVTINYRLGPLGFLAHALLTAESDHGASGNYGFLDQVAALEWVRDNARELGGDPGNVTIFGESAGGVSVCLHLGSSLSGGLFHRAVIESAGCPKAMQKLSQSTAQYESGESVGARTAAALGCDGSADVLGCMRAEPAADVLAALDTCTSAVMCANGVRYGAIVDGWAFPEAPGLTVAAGRQHDVPVLGGTNADEGALWRTVIVAAGITTVAAYQAWVQATFGVLASAVLQAYPVTTDAEARPTVERVLTDFVFVCPTRAYGLALAAVQSQTWLYSFSWVSPPAQVLGYGAFHAAEIPYVFHSLPATSGYGANDDELSRAVVGYWTRFARTGDPNGDGAVAWPAFDAGEHYLELSLPIVERTGYRQAQCQAFAELF
ncbi:MAG: carboxylesterase family protein [Deltaproteobacteria bacterium]|nr:carboxylesterase family protein [Deltaproteobacteria bacterium]